MGGWMEATAAVFLKRDIPIPRFVRRECRINKNFYWGNEMKSKAINRRFSKLAIGVLASALVFTSFAGMRHGRQNTFGNTGASKCGDHAESVCAQLNGAQTGDDEQARKTSAIGDGPPRRGRGVRNLRRHHNAIRQVPHVPKIRAWGRTFGDRRQSASS